MFISKILIFLTVLFAFIFPTDVNGAVLKVDNQVTTADSVIEYTYENETGYVISGDCWVEKIEMKVLDNWQEVPVSEPEVDDVEKYLNPGASYSGKYEAGLLLPGTYKITIGYNVCNEFDATTVGYASAEFDVAIK